MFLPYIDLTTLNCKYEGSTKCLCVQDFNTTVRRTIERITNGVVTPDALRNNGLTYEDIGLPKMDTFERIDLLRETAGKIEDIKLQLSQQPKEQPTEQPKEQPTEQTPSA